LAAQVDGAEGERQNENRGERPADNHLRSLPACETRSQGGRNEKASVLPDGCRRKPRDRYYLREGTHRTPKANVGL
jgi:hypothetical protein